MGIKILLADDSVTAQNMGKKILSEAGHEVITVSNGAAAKKKIAEIKPELVLLDVFMPGYSGLEICEKLRNASETSTLPVLLTVGRMEPYSPQEGARVKADGVIVKPFEASDLIAAVERLAEKIKPAKKEASERERGAKAAQESKSDSVLAWKLETPAEGAAILHSTDLKPYEATVRLDTAQIAAILEPAAAEDQNDNPASQRGISAATPVHSTEEFEVRHADSNAQSASIGTGTPAFTDDLPAMDRSGRSQEKSSSSMPSYMAQYMGEHAEAASSEPAAFKPPMVKFVAQTSPASLMDPNATAEIPVFTQLAPGIPIHHDLLPHHASAELGGDPPVATVDGLEFTSAAAVGDVPVTREAGFEATAQSSDSAAEIASDPSLVKDRHLSTTDFPTHFGINEAIEAEFPTHSESIAPPTDEFEARLNAAMSSYAEPSADLSKDLSGTDSPESEITVREAGSFESQLQVAMHSFEPVEEPAAETTVETAVPVESAATALGETATEESLQPQTVSSAQEPEQETETRVEMVADAYAADPSPMFAEPEISEASEELAPPAQPVSTHVIASSQPELAAALMESMAGPVHETDDAVIQQMREALSGLPGDLVHATETADPAPLAMAAAAGSDAVTLVGTNSAPDANHLAVAVEKVMQRELPNLIWKIMAELDLRNGK